MKYDAPRRPEVIQPLDPHGKSGVSVWLWLLINLVQIVVIGLIVGLIGHAAGAW